MMLGVLGYSIAHIIHLLATGGYRSGFYVIKDIEHVTEEGGILRKGSHLENGGSVEEGEGDVRLKFFYLLLLWHRLFLYCCACVCC